MQTGEFLDITPLVGSTEANYYLTPEDAEAATIACYNNLQQEVTNIQGSAQLAAHFRWYFGDICSDDSFKGGSGDGDEPDLFLFENFQGNSSSRILLGEWQVAYRGIAYCNLALNNVPNIEMDPTEQARYLGEAAFIRVLVLQLGDRLWRCAAHFKQPFAERVPTGPHAASGGVGPNHRRLDLST